MSYRAPDNILDVLKDIEQEQGLEPDDPRYVDTQEARGSRQTLKRLAKIFGLDLSSGRFAPADQRHTLFFGHTGSGKTTELRRYAKALSGPDKYFVVEVDTSSELDCHNLQYADTLMAMATTLLKRLGQEQVLLPDDALQPLQDWFATRVLNYIKSRDISAEIKTGIEAKLGIPVLASLFATVTTAFKTNATYKEDLRREIRNTFADFADAFNRLLRQTEKALDQTQSAKRVLFVVDGTDKLRGEDHRAFFVQDAEQLLAINAHVIYAAPLSLKYEGNLTNRLGSLVLPMIKLQERDGNRCEAGWQALRSILLLRADRTLFASDQEIEKLVEFSGGHPREMLRLLTLCCEFEETGQIDAVAVDAAVSQLASEYRRFLEPEDYVLLVQIDRDTLHGGNTERARKLMYNLALLEYNDGKWQRSHPVVRTLEGYQRAEAAAQAAAAA